MKSTKCIYEKECGNFEKESCRPLHPNVAEAIENGDLVNFVCYYPRDPDKPYESGHFAGMSYRELSELFHED